MFTEAQQVKTLPFGRLLSKKSALAEKMLCILSLHQDSIGRCMKSARKKARSEQLEDLDRQSPPARPQEQLLIERVESLEAQRVLCTTAGRGQFARELAMAKPQTTVTCLFLDLYPLQQSEQIDLALPANLRRICQADLPEDEVDLAVIFCSAHGIAELSRDLLQQGYDRLAPKGKLIATIDNPEDQWLHEELQKFAAKVTREPQQNGVIYTVVKTAPLAKQKKFDAEFAFRDQGRLIFMHSRPGVFSHRHLDTGARALINPMVIHPKMRVLDLGCGSGAVGVAAALRQPEAEVWAIDSNPRAVQCAELSALRNGVQNLTTRLDADGSGIPLGYFDLILANPPYYSQYRLADLFLKTTAKSLNDDGELLLVTKSPGWFREHLPDWFREIDEQQPKEYFVFTCRRKVIPYSRRV